MNDVWRLTFINNVNACFLFIPAVLIFEGDTLREVSRDSALLVDGHSVPSNLSMFASNNLP